jgi:hypothetical protein
LEGYYNIFNIVCQNKVYKVVRVIDYDSLDNNMFCEDFEDNKEAIRSRKSKKDRQHNGQNKIKKSTNNDLQHVAPLTFIHTAPLIMNITNMSLPWRSWIYQTYCSFDHEYIKHAASLSFMNISNMPLPWRSWIYQTYHPVGRVPKFNRKTKYTTLSEEFQNLIEKQNIPHCRKSSKI